jgi:hypothetical protein
VDAEVDADENEEVEEVAEDGWEVLLLLLSLDVDAGVGVGVAMRVRLDR